MAGGPRIGTVGADDIQVNSYTTGNQRNAAVAMDADGDFVVVWQSNGSGGTDTLGYSIQGQRYASDGSAVGGQFQVNTYATGFEVQPSVAMHADGDFVVVWWGVRGQRFAADGSALGGEFQVSTYTGLWQGEPAVAMDADGDIVVVWEYLGTSDPDNYATSIQGRRFASDGSAAGSQFQVNTSDWDYQELPAVAMDAPGNFVVSWTDVGSYYEHGQFYSWVVASQRYTADGSTAGGEFQVSVGQVYWIQPGPSIAADEDGDFVVVWEQDYSKDPSLFGIVGRRLASGGSVVGGEFQVNTYYPGNQFWPSVAMDPAGGFVAVWQSQGSGGTDDDHWSIQGRRFAADGSGLGGDFQINSFTPGNQEIPSVAVNDFGYFVVVWESDGSPGTDKDGSSIQMRTFLPSIFTDGFESGDVLRWTASFGP